MRTAIRVAAGLAIGLVALLAYARHKIDAEGFALDPATILAGESWKGVPFTGASVAEIEEIVSQQKEAKGSAGCEPLPLLWLGNSQLHYINHFRKGQHTAPFWVRQALPCPDAVVPLAASLPHANLQEQFVLAVYVQRRIPIRAIILQLAFNDLREDGLRDDFSGLITAADRAALNESETGAAILVSADAAWQGQSRAGDGAGLQGFAQKRVEDALNRVLAENWPLWDDRVYLRTRLVVDLYDLRNAVFRIKPTTVRRIVPLPYERNMRALRGLLQEARSRKLPILAYVAPIRSGSAHALRGSGLRILEAGGRRPCRRP